MYLPYSKYQKSHEAWLSEFPDPWKERKLKFAVNLISSKVESRSHDGIEFMGLEHIESWTGKKVDGGQVESEGVGSLFIIDDILFGKLRPYLAKVYRAENAGIATTEALVLRKESFCDANFIKYYLLNPSFIDVVNGSTYGSKMPRANWDFIGNLRMLLPSLEEQQKIATFLDYKTQQIDRLIEKKKALIEKLEEKRIAVITQAVTKGLDKDVKFVPSGVDWLGDVPEGWGVRKLRFLLSMNLTNGLFKKASFWGKGIRIVNVFDVYIHGDIVNEQSLDRVECDNDEYKKYSALDGDFFFVRSSLKLEGVGKSATVITPTEESVFECHLVRGRPDQSEVDPLFLNFFLNSKYARNYFVSAANVVTMATIDQMKLKNLILSLPPLQTQRNIVTHLQGVLAGVDGMKDKTIETITKLEEYRSSLITAAVTGKIDVRNWQQPSDAI